MKLMILSLVGVATASALTPVPAAAQRWHDSRGWHEGRYNYGGRWYNPPRGYYRNGYWNGRRWRGGRRSVVCRWENRRYGRVEVCRRYR